jgi:hypothetical protein
MLRLVKTLETGDAAYFLLCDHRQCMEARRGNAVVTNTDDYRLSERTFLKAEEKTKQVVEPARPEHVLAFGRGRP